MGVRANWFVAEDAADEDPVGSVALPPVVERIEDVGVPFDLRDPDSLLTASSRLISREADLFNQGVTCEVKDRQDTSCSACPYAHHQDQEHPLQPLCEIGREQERIITMHAHLTLR